MPPTFQAFRNAVASQTPSLDPGRPGLKVLLAVAAVAIAVAAYFAWRSQPVPQPLPPPPTPIAPSTPSPTAKVTVHIAGKIRNPGVYLLSAGSRVTDAVTAAGGVSRGASTGGLNLARRLLDGEQIVVGAAAAGPALPGSPAADPATAILDLNSATPDQLEQLPGIGEVLAARIAEFRTTHGGFTSVDQLREVSGIGARKFDEIKTKVRI
ncbi:helix-hairpin-helix domain-containing protein [Nonomuraea sp. NPDC002799]